MFSRIFFLINLFILSASSLFAVGGNIESPHPGLITTTPWTLVSSIITYAIGLAAILGVIGITWWGIQMVLSIGEDEKMKKWRYIVIYSIIGVILAGLAYSIVSIIGNIKI